MICCSDDSLYTGITNNVARRWQQHLSSKGAKYFRGRAPKSIVYLEEAENRSVASQREYAIKQLSRQAKLRLIQQHEAITHKLKHHQDELLEKQPRAQDETPSPSPSQVEG